MPHKLGILLSGRGSNFLAIAESCRAGRIDAEIAIVISNRADAPGLARAHDMGLSALLIPSRGRLREEHDLEVIAALHASQVELICLAGYMRLLSPAFIRAFPHRILNIHPSLLPAFPGTMHAIAEALAYGVRVTGVTVHFVTTDLDAGPIILQEAVSIRDDDTLEALTERVQAVEHRLLPRAIALYAADRLEIAGRHVRIRPANPDET